LPLEELDRALVLFRRFECFECAEVPPFPGLGILLTGVKTISTGLQFANHPVLIIAKKWVSKPFFDTLDEDKGE
jgi:hypothetical protein